MKGTRSGSRVGGALVGFTCIVAAVVAALWVSGHFETFSRNRGMLQIFVAIPASCLVTSALLAFFGILVRDQMLWSLLPVGVSILAGVGVLGPGFTAWPWMVGLGAPVLVPWVMGFYLGSLARPVRERKPRDHW